jgi:hypothetical protein
MLNKNKRLLGMKRNRNNVEELTNNLDEVDSNYD